MPDFIPPMSATLATHPFSDPDWLFEVKWDGYRVEAVVRDGKVRLWTRRRQDARPTSRTSPRRRGWIDAREAIVDGEVVALDEQGRPQLQPAPGSHRHPHLAHARRQAPRRPRRTVVYQAFDLLHLDGQSLLSVPLEERKRLLRSRLRPHPLVRYAGHVEARRGGVLRGRPSPGAGGHRRQAEALAVRAGSAQPLVAEAQGPARAGGRGRRLAAGAGEPRRPRLADPRRALRRPLGARRPGRQRARRADAARAPRPPARDRAAGLGRSTRLRGCAAPAGSSREIVIRVEFAEWTADDLLRQAAFKGFDPDRDPRAVRREREVPTERATAEAERAHTPDPMPSAKAATADPTDDDRRARGDREGGDLGRRRPRDPGHEPREGPLHRPRGRAAGHEARPAALPRRGRPDARAVPRPPRPDGPALSRTGTSRRASGRRTCRATRRNGSSAGRTTTARRGRRSTRSSTRPPRSPGWRRRPRSSCIRGRARSRRRIARRTRSSTSTRGRTRPGRSSSSWLGCTGPRSSISASSAIRRSPASAGIQVWIGIAPRPDVRRHAELGGGHLARRRRIGPGPRQLGVGEARAQGQGAARLHPERHQQDARRPVQHPTGARRAGEHADHLGGARRPAAAPGPMDDPRRHGSHPRRAAIRSPACSPTTRSCRRSADVLYHGAR